MWIRVLFFVFLSELRSFGYDEDLKQYFVYYDVHTKQPFRLVSIKNSLTNEDEGKRQTTKEIGFRSNGCSCDSLTCGCCLGVRFDQFNFRREGCLSFMYDPEQFSVTMDMIMDGKSIYSNTVSARNPPPLCLPLPIPFLPTSVEMCAKLFDIHTPGQRLHMCVDMETRVDKASVLILHFDCLIMGGDGVAILKPGESENYPPPPPDSQENSDVFDEINEMKVGKNSSSQLHARNRRIKLLEREDV